MNHDGKVKGVIQVSRKAETNAAAGKDFSQTDLILLQKMADVIAGYL